MVGVMVNKKNEAIVIAVVEAGMTLNEAATRFNVSTRWVRELVKRYQQDGLAGVQPRSRRPHTSPQRTSEQIRQRIVFIHDELTRAGLDAGAESVRDRLTNQDGSTPATSTIWRILTHAGRVKTQPQKRPKSSWTRFEADLPNETWQSDVTHLRLADSTDVEVISWLDDHSRFLLHISAHTRATGHTVIDTFTDTTREHGYPASTLTDNGMIYTARFARGATGDSNQLNMFEKLLADLGIRQKNGKPGHPTTQGKIERFHQTLKRWITARPASENLNELNKLLREFQSTYNTTRPHRALTGRVTPAVAYQHRPKAEPTIDTLGHTWRVRHDKVDESGAVTFRYASKLKHLGIGRAHAGAPVIILANGPNTMVINRNTGEIIAEHHIDENRDYQAKTRWKK